MSKIEQLDYFAGMHPHDYDHASYSEQVESQIDALRAKLNEVIEAINELTKAVPKEKSGE